MNTRISGACAIGLGVITWLARDLHYPEARRVITYGLLTTFIILVVIDLNGIITGAVDKFGWVIFVCDSFLSIGSSYQFLQVGVAVPEPPIYGGHFRR